ncbi:hypothetical protein OSB04_018452 [Centaurea solstitialis]|uniref:Uncharacterized protein n=1 Tax=Centaurea solstitialis TaxID=347529 RepID=A0AA38WAH8_9ASTR|nr:hypothetical protein OSB04_018452 [Centaurea solstitialis]
MHRNALVFSGVKTNLLGNFFEMQRSAFEWISRKVTKWSKRWEEWLTDPAMNGGNEEGRRWSGFCVIETINEPVAAATACGLGKQDDITVLVVFHLGGATFDILV